MHKRSFKSQMSHRQRRGVAEAVTHILHKDAISVCDGCKTVVSKLASDHRILFQDEPSRRMHN